MHGDRGDIITGYLVRLVLGLGLAGMLLIEAGALTINHIGLDNTVERAARQAAVTYRDQRSPSAAERAAEATLDRSGATMVGFEVDRATVTVTGTRPARVLASDRIDALEWLVTPDRTHQAAVGSR